MGSPVRDIGVSMRQLLILSSLTLAVSAFDNAMQWLTDDLFNDQRYDKTLIPIEDAPMESGENAVSLGIGLTLRNLDMDAAGNLRVNAWVKATWKDYRLSWEPVEYEGIKKLNLPSDMIWRPDISIYNQASYSNDDADKQLRKSDYNTIILADGTVIWIPPVSFTVDCTYRKRGGVMTMEDPNAEQDCHIMLGSWTQDANHMHVDYRFKVQRAYHIENGIKVYDMEPSKIQSHIRDQ